VAQIVAREPRRLSRDLRCDREGRRSRGLLTIRKRDVLFIDEIHRSARSRECCIGDGGFQLDLIIGEGPARARSRSAGKITLVGATKRAAVTIRCAPFWIPVG